MDSTEQIVGLRMSQRSKKRLLEYAGKHPELKGRLDKAIQQYKTAIYDDFFSRVPLEGEEKEEIRKELDDKFTPILDQITNTFSYESYIENLGHGYRTADEINREVNKIIDDVKKEKEFSPAIDLNIIKSTTQTLSLYAKTDDIIVARLAEIARKKGVDKAVTDENIYATIREMYPTEQLYRENLELRIKEGKAKIRGFERLVNLEKVIETTNEFDKIILNTFNVLFGGVFTKLEPIVDIWLELYKEMDDDTIKKVYNPKKKSPSRK